MNIIHQKIRTISTYVLLIFFISGSSYSQDRVEMQEIVRGHKDDPLSRLKEQNRSRAYSDGTLPNVWMEFKRIWKNNHQSQMSLAAPTWVNIGPDGLDSVTGRITCHTFYPGNEKSIIVGAASGGLWKSENGGDSWNVLNDRLPSLWVSSVSINPNDTNHILIGTGFYMGVSLSLQAGIGVLESFDGGLSWNENTLSFPFESGVSINKIIWDSNNPSNIFVATSIGLWSSVDKGKSWNVKMQGIVSDLDIIDTGKIILFASVHSKGIYKSTDYGDSWLKLKSGLPNEDEMDRINLDICKGHPSFIITSIIDPINWGVKGVYKTSNGGDTWEKLKATPDFQCIGNENNCQGWLGWYVNTVAVSPHDTNLLFLGGPKLYRSINGGKDWVQQDEYKTNFKQVPGNVHADQWDIGFSKDNQSTVFLFNDGGVYRSDNKGAFWHKKNRGLITAQIYRIASSPIDPFKIVAGVQDNGLYYLNNFGGNLTWNRWVVGDGCSVTWDPNDTNIAYGNRLLGENFKLLNPWGTSTSVEKFNSGIVGQNTFPFHFVLTHHPIESNHLYTANDNYIFRSTDGSTWDIISNIPNVKAIAISKSNPSTVYASTYSFSGSDAFYVSYDGGDNWDTTASTFGWGVTDVEADPNNYGTLYATRNSGVKGLSHVYKSINHGASWISIGKGLPDVSTNTITVNPFNSNTVYVGTDIGVYMSDDAGLTWTDFNNNLPPYIVMDMHFHGLDSTLRIGTLGRGVWKAKFVAQKNIVDDKSIEGSKVFISVNPNPSTGNFNIKLQPLTHDYYTISIQNELGQKVKSIYSGNLEKGNNEFIWDGKNSAGKTLPNGVYYIELSTKSYRKFSKIIILR